MRRPTSPRRLGRKPRIDEIPRPRRPAPPVPVPSTGRDARIDQRAGRKIGVVLVDSLHVVRSGLALLISTHSDMDVLAEADSADAALEFLAGMRRRLGIVVLVSVGLAGERDAFWLIRAIRERFPTMPILAIGANVEEMTISRALFAGADGFLDKRSAPEEFVEAVRRALGGEVVLTGVPMERLGDVAQGLDVESSGEQQLTDREIEVMSVAAEGLTARQIARRLGVSERTVTTHLQNIYQKLGVGNRVAALAAAGRTGALRSRPVE
jgi:DNA-binding NarL/FixJ family response regulator